MSGIKGRVLVNYDKVLAGLIKKSESFDGIVYVDLQGIPTIGYGFALAAGEGKRWGRSSYIDLLPRELSEAQDDNLLKMIANLRDFRPGKKARDVNRAALSSLGQYSMTVGEAEELLAKVISREESEVVRILKNAGATDQDIAGLAGTREMAAMVDAKFNAVFGGRTARAYLSGIRAELWYEFRYNNKSAINPPDIGLQKRRYWEAELVGLSEGQSFTEQEAKEAYFVLTKNRERIFKSESIHGVNPDGSGRGSSRSAAGFTALEMSQDAREAGPLNNIRSMAAQAMTPCTTMPPIWQPVATAMIC